MHNGLLLTIGDFYWLKINTEVVLIVCFREIITVINNTIPTKNMNMLANCNIFRLVILLFSETHAWVMCEDGFLGEFLFS